MSISLSFLALELELFEARSFRNIFPFSRANEGKIVNIQWKGKFKLIVDLAPFSPVSPLSDSKFSARPQFLVRERERLQIVLA